MDVDAKARQAVEGVPQHRYGILAVEGDPFPAAPLRRTRNVPEDVRRTSRMCITTDDIAHAILAERSRCAAVAMSSAHTDCEVAEQIAAMIESGQ